MALMQCCRVVVVLVVQLLLALTSLDLLLFVSVLMQRVWVWVRWYYGCVVVGVMVLSSCCYCCCSPVRVMGRTGLWIATCCWRRSTASTGSAASASSTRTVQPTARRMRQPLRHRSSSAPGSIPWSTWLSWRCSQTPPKILGNNAPNFGVCVCMFCRISSLLLNFIDDFRDNLLFLKEKNCRNLSLF